MNLKRNRDLARKQLPLVEALLAAIQSDDLAKAKAAYVESRPPYEQIEVLVASFEQTDSDAATAVKEAHAAALALVQPYFQQGQTAAQPYSSLDETQRGKITQASYRLRDTLVKAGEILQLT